MEEKRRKDIDGERKKISKQCVCARPDKDKQRSSAEDTEAPGSRRR